MRSFPNVSTMPHRRLIPVATATPAALRRARAGAVTVAVVASLAACRAPGASPDAGVVPVAPDAIGGAPLLDGDFDDWREVPPLIAEPFGDARPVSGAVDLGPVHATDEPSHWWLTLALADSASLQALPGTVHLLVDADADVATGATVFGTRGVELVLELSRADRRQAGGAGAGVALRLAQGDTLGAPRGPYDLGVAALPTWSAPRFELRIERAAEGLPRLDGRVRLRLVYTVGDTIVDATDVAVYAFRTPAAPAAPRIADVPPRVPGTLRIAQWNVSEGSFRRPQRHARLLALADADVLLLDEVYAEITDSALATFFAEPALAVQGPWTWVRGRSGGRQKTVIAARGAPVRAEPSMVRVTYPRGAIDALRARVPAWFHGALAVEDTAHLSATGAWRRVDGRDVLFVVLDLQSAGYHGSPQDGLRLLQAQTVRHAVTAALDSAARANGARPPVLIAGDFNPVGAYAPVAELQRALDIAGGDLTLSPARRLGERSLLTWRNREAALFGPGRLDLTLYGAQAFTRVQAAVLAAEELPPARLAAVGLDADAARRTADHLIVITDLRTRDASPR